MTKHQQNVVAVALQMQAIGKHYTRKQLQCEFHLGHNFALKIFNELNSNSIYTVKDGIVKGSLKVLAVNYQAPVKPFDSEASQKIYQAKSSQFWNLVLGVNAPQGA